MNILINASNLKVGGGLQVAGSFISQVDRFPQHKFYIVLPDALMYLQGILADMSNVWYCKYNIENSIFNIIINRNKYLDSIVVEKRIDVVFTIFGPSIWRPKVRHVCGYARPHIVYTDSPFFGTLSIFERVKSKFRAWLNIQLFDKNSDILITENIDVSKRLEVILPDKKIFTVTNYYNQIFDEPEKWDKSIILPPFDGVTLLTVTANYPHKNLNKIGKVVRYLKSKYPQFKFRFVITLNAVELDVQEQDRDCILCVGKLNVEQCPYLYKQADLMFLPTLLECFSASYPEAMKMKIPIVTSDLTFARGLCGDAAEYFDPMSVSSIGDTIYYVAKDENRKLALINTGMLQLDKYDTYWDRANKYIKILEW